ncbi:hypothetical protein ACFHW2_38625 [Actinomadura sp. LOL_016]|uniref:hypothetical protein n=1 Tax=unclassified Actinomadura TaxID=2626254 RepID=UPI003A8080BC
MAAAPRGRRGTGRPETLVRARGTLYVVRSQFDDGGPLGPGTPETPFTVAAVRGL